MVAEITQVLTIIGPTCAGLWILYQYVDQKREKNKADAVNEAHLAETRRFESRKPFLELKLKSYLEISEIVGMLVSEQPGTEMWKAALKRFWSYYWSQLSIVESAEIEKIMVSIGDCLDAYGASSSDDEHTKLQNNVYLLAHQIRKEVESDWKQEETRPLIDGQKSAVAMPLKEER